MVFEKLKSFICGFLLVLAGLYLTGLIAFFLNGGAISLAVSLYSFCSYLASRSISFLFAGLGIIAYLSLWAIAVFFIGLILVLGIVYLLEALGIEI